MDHPREREKCSRKSWLPWRRGWPSQRTWSRGRGQQHADQTNINGMISMLTSSSGNRRRAMRASSPKTYVSLCKDVRSLFVNASRNLRISLRHVFGLGGHSGARGFISAQGAVDKPGSQAIKEKTHNTQSFQHVVFFLDAICQRLLDDRFRHQRSCTSRAIFSLEAGCHRL